MKAMFACPRCSPAAYFEKGKMNGDFLQNWVLKDPEATLPESINDKRQGGVLLGMGRVG